MPPLPFYRLKELIIEKYGEDKFEAGCDLVVRWLRHELNATINVSEIKFMCNIDQSSTERMTYPACTSLLQLFRLQSHTELYTLPETAPQYTNQTTI